MRLILHVGAPKIGSSSLQSLLTKELSLGMVNNQDPKLPRYAIWSATGEVLQPDWRLRLKPPYSWLGYLNSGIRFKSLNDSHVVDAFERTLREVNVLDHDLVLSSERWLAEVRELDEQGVDLSNFLQRCSQLGVEPECVLYVRPQVTWLNSAFWQWDFWAGTSPEEFLTQQLHMRSGDWCVSVRALHRLGFPQVEIRYARDVVGDFLGYLGYSTKDFSYSQVNAASSVGDLRILSKFPQLRTVHDPTVEFALAGAHRDPERPWAFSSRQVLEILDRHADSNEELVMLLPEGMRAVWAEDLADTRDRPKPEVTHPEMLAEGWVESRETERMLERALDALKNAAPAWQLECLQEEVRLLRTLVLESAIHVKTQTPS